MLGTGLRIILVVVWHKIWLLFALFLRIWWRINSRVLDWYLWQKRFQDNIIFLCPVVIRDHIYTGLQWKWGSRQKEIQTCKVEEKRKTRKFNVGDWACDIRDKEKWKRKQVVPWYWDSIQLILQFGKGKGIGNYLFLKKNTKSNLGEWNLRAGEGFSLSSQ